LQQQAALWGWQRCGAEERIGADRAAVLLLNRSSLLVGNRIIEEGKRRETRGRNQGKNLVFSKEGRIEGKA
jgi:hypothetical protein